MDSDTDTVFKSKLLGKHIFSIAIMFFCRTGSKTHMKAMRGSIFKNFESKYLSSKKKGHVITKVHNYVIITKFCNYA
jgi:hypothetical protein